LGEKRYEIWDRRRKKFKSKLLAFGASGVLVPISKPPFLRFSTCSPVAPWSFLLGE